MSTEWNGEDWLQFYEACEEVRDRLHVSLGAAERSLRELCASGDVRAIRYDTDGYGNVIGEGATFIKPSEWSAAEVDLEGEDDGTHWIEVSEADLRYWIEQQAKPKAIGKQPRIKALLAEIFPNHRVPDPAHCPRKALKADLLKRDPSLKPLDEATLKSAIEDYNADPKRS
jgi:hypothetical protein